MRKIALISDHASPLALTGGVDSGGQNIYVAAIARQLARRGVAVDVFTRRDNALHPEIVRWHDGVRVVHVPAGPARHVPKESLLPWMADFGEVLLEFMRREVRTGARPYDLIHANFFMSGLAARRVVQCLGLPLVMTFHALGRVRRRFLGERDRFPDARFAIEEELVRTADRIVAECPQDRLDLISLYQADPQRIDIVPCGFDPAELAPIDKAEARNRLGWPQRRFVILQLGRLVPRKGIDNLIRALALLKRERGVNARLYIVGGDSAAPNCGATPEIGRLTDIARAAGVSGQVQFVGRRGRPHLRQLYSAADVFVTTPWYEPFGITAVEAMACGVPVIATAVGGLRTTVVDGETGYLVQPDAPAMLAARLATIAAHPRARDILGEAGRQRANRLYTWAHVCDSLCEVYQRACGSAGDGAVRVDHERAREHAAVGAPAEAAGELAPAMNDAVDAVDAIDAIDAIDAADPAPRMGPRARQHAAVRVRACL